MTNINSNEKKLLESYVDDRFNFIYGDAHGIGYIIDPRFVFIYIIYIYIYIYIYIL